VGIAGRGRGIVPSESGVGLGVRLSVGAGVGSDRTVSGVRSGDACGAKRDPKRYRTLPVTERWS
jgi:hypothetical protein